MITLDYFKTHPMRVPKNQRDLTIGQLVAAETATVIHDDIHPSAGAFIHYGGVELADQIAMLKPVLSQDELTALTQAWYGSCGIVAKQLLFYIWRIISKELRHGSSGMCVKAFGPLGVGFHPDAVSLCTTICAGGDYGEHLLKFPNLPAASYVDAVEQHFRKGGWGGAYGGKKWADIALVFKRYLDGEISAMIAADRAWTLVHNTGPIFNKGFYFEHHDSGLMKVLNAQATSSVFSLGLEFLSKPGYGHQTTDTFLAFVGLASKAIAKAKPGYKLGQGGGVNSDGSKPVPGSKGEDDDDTGGPEGATHRTIGPLVLFSHPTREEVPQ